MANQAPTDPLRPAPPPTPIERYAHPGRTPCGADRSRTCTRPTDTAGLGRTHDRCPLHESQIDERTVDKPTTLSRQAAESILESAQAGSSPEDFVPDDSASAAPGPEVSRETSASARLPTEESSDDTPAVTTSATGRARATTEPISTTDEPQAGEATSDPDLEAASDVAGAQAVRATPPAAEPAEPADIAAALRPFAPSSAPRIRLLPTRPFLPMNQLDDAAAHRQNLLSTYLSGYKSSNPSTDADEWDGPDTPAPQYSEPTVAASDHSDASGPSEHCRSQPGGSV
jgi:hypothetical protein